MKVGIAPGEAGAAAAGALVPVAVPGRRARWLGGLAARPFAGIPLVLGDAAYRPLFVFFLLIGTAAGLWLNFVPLWLAQGFGATPAQVGWFYSASFLAAAAGNFTMPVLAERLGSRKTVAIWLLLSGVPCLVALAFANGYWMALLAIAPLWFGAGFFGLMLGLAGDVARARARVEGRDRSGAVLAALQAASALGGAVAPLLGAWLYEQTGGLRAGILLHLVPGLAATWVLWRHVRDDAGGEETAVQHGAASAATDAADAARRGRTGRTGAGAIGAVGLPLLVLLGAEVWFRLGDSRGPFELIYAAETLGASKAQVGLLLTTFAALQLILTPAVGVLADRIGAGVVTALGIAVLAVHGLLLAGTTAYWQQLALVALPALGLAIGSAVPFVFAQQLAPGRASTATGWLNACFFLGLAAGSPLAGRVAELAGYRGLFVFSGAMDLSAALMVGVLTFWVATRTGPPAPRSPG